MRLFSIGLVCAAAIVTVGCASSKLGHPSLTSELGPEVKRSMARDLVVAVLEGEKAQGPATYEDYVIAVSATETSQTDQTTALEKRQRLRNVLLDCTDARCDAYLADLGLIRRGYRSFLAVATTTLGAAGPLSRSKDAKGLFSGLAGAASGVRGNLEEEVFASQAMPLMLVALQGVRAKARAELLDQDPGSAAEVVASATSYAELCSLNQALVAVSSKVSQ
jgi:hypothetical protein